MCGFGTGLQAPGGISGCIYGDATLANCHNMGNITVSNNAGEIYGFAYGNISLTYCTYLTKTSNADSNGATGVSSMSETELVNDCITQMNIYVNNNAGLKLKEWKLINGNLTFMD